MLPKSIATFIKGVLILAAPLLIGLLVFKNGVDFPVLDEWDGTAPLFEKMADGTLGVADFFAQHNEHRIFFPRLIFFTLGRLTHWNIRAELWVIWFLALVCLFSIWQLARRTHSVRPFWISFAASVLLFSPLGVANFLWGFQIGFLLPLACVTTCIWTAASVRYPFNFLVAIILCTISTFSIASGFHQLVARHAAAVARECTIAFLQKMVDHLGFPFLVRTVALFLGLRTTAQSSTNLVVPCASDHGYRIYSPLFRRPL